MILMYSIHTYFNENKQVVSVIKKTFWCSLNDSNGMKWSNPNQATSSVDTVSILKLKLQL